MTVGESTFPIGYFYIISKMNGLCLDLRGDAKEAQPGTKIVMDSKKPESPERDSQLWIHQDGFLTNKASGLVLDINPAESFMAIFTKEKRLYLDHMKEAENADDQRFGYDAEPGYIYKLSEPEKVLDIRHEDSEPDARVVLHKRKEEDNTNQLWTFEPADPPQMVDSDDEEEDDSKRARLRAWFGSWKGWHDDKKKDILDEEKLHEAHKKIYENEEKKKKSHLSYELIAGAVAWQAYNMWEKKQKEEGKEVDYSLSKKLISSFAAAELVKILAERGEDNDDEDDKPSLKKRMLTDMAVSAATNMFMSRHGSN